MIAVLSLITTICALYSENLNLKQFPDGKVLAEFEFTRSSINLSSNIEAAYEIMPRSLREIVEKSRVTEFSLSFTKGRWYESRYGYEKTAPSGANLVAWFPNDTNTNTDAEWELLVNGLAGLTCSSLNFMTSTVTWTPNLAYKASVDAQLIPRAASLPREIVCTENLTPWAKLLPCQSKSGLAKLLNGYKLFDADYQSLGIQLIPKCVDISCQTMEFTLQQTVTILLDPLRTTNSKSNFKLTQIGALLAYLSGN